MKWASAASEEASLQESLEELAGKIKDQMGEGPIDLAFLFVSSHFQKEYAEIPALLSKSLGCKTLIGCSAGGVIGGGKEIEQKPAITLTAARLPGVEIIPFHLDNSVLPDPYSFDAKKWLMGLDFGFPASAKVGGLASGGAVNRNALFLNDVSYPSGMIGVALSGNIQVDTIVAQGCRPIGEPLSITRCDRNLLIEIDHKPSLLVLQELYEKLNEEDQKKMQHSLFLGLAMTPFKEDLTRGDFLIRNLIGVDSKSGNIAVGA